MAQPAASTTRTQIVKTFVLGFIFVSYPGGNWRLFSNKPRQRAGKKCAGLVPPSSVYQFFLPDARPDLRRPDPHFFSSCPPLVFAP
jgi:hypothetical protein